MRVDAGRDYYAILGLPEAASDEEIKRAYRRLALRHHPDRNPGDKRAEERFKEISEAYAVLMDPSRRQEHDRVRRGSGQRARAGGSRWHEEDLFRDLFTDPRTASVFHELAREWEQRGLRFNESFVRDLFFGGRAVIIIDGSGIRWAGPVASRAWFQGVSRQRATVGGRETVARLWGRVTEALAPLGNALKRLLALREPGSRRGDLEYEVQLLPRELRDGGRYHVTIERTGRTEELLVRVPPGTRVDSRLRLRGKGERGADGATGDLYLRVRLKR